MITYVYGGSLNTVAAAEIATIFGTDLLDPAGPSGMKVLVNGAAAPFYANASCKCVNFQIPPGTPLGTASILISVHGVASSPFQVSVKPYSPESSTNDGIFSNARHLDGTLITTNSPATPGERIVDFETGFGAMDPPPTPALTLGGFSSNVEDLSAVQFQNVPGLYQVTFAVPPYLTSGNQTLLIKVGGVTSEPRVIPVLATGLVLSQRGTTFNAVVGSNATQQRNIFVLAPSSTINWTATASTLSGGNWLQVSPATGTSDPSHSPAIQITANANGLQPDDYYGTVTIKPVGTNTAQILMVVLNVLPPTQSPGTTVEPTGLVFVAPPGATLPSAQTVQIANPTTANLSFTATPSVPSGAVWFKFAPASGTVAPGQFVNMTIQPSSSLPAGTYPGTLTVQFSDGKTRVVNLLFVVAAGASTSAVTAHDAGSANAPSPQAGCTPTKLLPVFTLLGVNFTSPVAWPTPIQAQVVDDCGTPIKSGSVTLTFSNGDPALGLASLQNGTWANTWVPRKAVTSALVVALKAQVFTPALEGTATVSGSAPPNPEVPIINSGGIVGTASYVASPAPGSLISLFGISLADGLAQANALPLPDQLGTSSLMIGGVTVPLIFVSENQVNALVPYGLQTKGKYQAIVQHGNAISSPETITVLDAQPAVFTTDQSGKGQGHVYKIMPDGAQILAAPNAPAHAGDVLTIYCTGLGEVNPPVEAGVPAPLDTLEPTVNPVMVTIGGVNAQVLFAGLTPGFTGLYQINVVVPDGVTAGDAVPVAISAAGQQSIPVSMAMQ